MLIKNGYLFTTCTNDFEKLDIRIENTKITEVDFNISPKENEEVIDAAGKYITPSLPGQTQAQVTPARTDRSTALSKGYRPSSTSS